MHYQHANNLVGAVSYCLSSRQSNKRKEPQVLLDGDLSLLQGITLLALQQLLPRLLSKVFLKRSKIKHRTAHPFDIFTPTPLLFISIDVYICMPACGGTIDNMFVAVDAYIYIQTDRRRERGGRERGREREE